MRLACASSSLLLAKLSLPLPSCNPLTHPSLPQVPNLINHLEVSSISAAIAFWLCMVRLLFYYSLFSTRFYSLRKAISCLAELIPALVLICITTLAFAFFLHTVFGSRQWSTIGRSVANLIVMLRKPSQMRLDEMDASDPLAREGIEGVMPPIIFLWCPLPLP